jgi:SAM-dependent methyltransferase
MPYDPEKYWENRISNRFNLSGVGNYIFSEFYNHFLYKAKIRAIKYILLKNGIELNNKTVCDIGCGTGFFVDFYSRNSASEVVGIDIATSSINHLTNKYPKYLFLKENISSSILLENIKIRFDIVNVFDVLYHITDDDLFMSALFNISSLVNENGYIFITDATGQNFKNYGEHVKFRDLGVYKRLFNETGIDFIDIYPLFYLLNRPIFAESIFLRILGFGLFLDNLFAPIYFLLDKLLLSSTRNNLSLIVARKSST